MTGKEFKEWVNTIPDGAIVETVDGSAYRQDWVPLDPRKIRAIMQPVLDSNALENIRS